MSKEETIDLDPINDVKHISKDNLLQLASKQLQKGDDSSYADWKIVHYCKAIFYLIAARGLPS